MGIFSNDNSSSGSTCPNYSNAENAPDPLFGNVSFYHFNIYLSGACTAFACLSIFIVLFRHATHLSKPNEQIKIMKIAIIIPFYAILSFISLCFPSSYDYIEPWLELVQAFSLGSFFLLLCEFVSPSTEQRDVFFAALRIEGRKGKVAGGIAWYRKRWFLIFQYPIIALLVAIATDITQAAGVYCIYSSSPHFAHLWLEVIANISVALAVISVIRIYTALKTHLAHHQPLAKLLAFKLIVGLTFLESIIFMILRSTNVLKPTSTLTWADLNVGIPCMIVCIEMVPFSLFFHHAYSVKPYIIRTGDSGSEEGMVGGAKYPQSYQGGFLGIHAWLVMWNPMEMLSAIKFGLSMATESKRADAANNVQLGRVGYAPLEYQEGRVHGRY